MLSGANCYRSFLEAEASLKRDVMAVG